jgi:hypothetical protein
MKLAPILFVTAILGAHTAHAQTAPATEDPKMLAARSIITGIWDWGYTNAEGSTDEMFKGLTSLYVPKGEDEKPEKWEERRKLIAKLFEGIVLTAREFKTAGKPMPKLELFPADPTDAPVYRNSFVFLTGYTPKEADPLGQPVAIKWIIHLEEQVAGTAQAAAPKLWKLVGVSYTVIYKR